MYIHVYIYIRLRISLLSENKYLGMIFSFLLKIYIGMSTYTRYDRSRMRLLGNPLFASNLRRALFMFRNYVR